MASRLFDNLSTIVQNTLTDSIRMIDIDELHESADNFFTVGLVEEFAETILGQGGVKDNLVVRPLETGGFEIISGHRRRAAVRYLLDRGENISRYLPCLVQSYSDDAARMLDLVLMNVSTRQLSDAELWECFEVLERIFREKKQAGEKFGRTRERLAEMLGVSPAQVGKMQNVERNAVQTVVDAVKSGEISISAANEIAKLDHPEQEKHLRNGLNAQAPKQSKPKKVATNSNSDKELLRFLHCHREELGRFLSEIIQCTDASDSKTITMLQALERLLRGTKE